MLKQLLRHRPRPSCRVAYATGTRPGSRLRPTRGVYEPCPWRFILHARTAVILSRLGHPHHCTSDDPRPRYFIVDSRLYRPYQDVVPGHE
ncbi:hypothetical protein PG994_015155 [Apiospora phragmitis]|uniref:Uncharacterized protein n=1 Tax=Apiospora phragmitis TaxID=2905665 RepID=A0ABR1SXW0_9PEZI